MSVLSTAAWQSFCIQSLFYSPLLCARLMLSFVLFSFSYHGCLPCIHLHLTCSVCIPILVTDKKHRTTYGLRLLLLGISNFPEYNISYDGVNHYSVLFLLLRSVLVEVKLTSNITSAVIDERDRLFGDQVVHKKQGPVSQKTLALYTHCLFA